MKITKNRISLLVTILSALTANAQLKSNVVNVLAYCEQVESTASTTEVASKISVQLESNQANQIKIKILNFNQNQQKAAVPANFQSELVNFPWAKKISLIGKIDEKT